MVLVGFCPILSHFDLSWQQYTIESSRVKFEQLIINVQSRANWNWTILNNFARTAHIHRLKSRRSVLKFSHNALEWIIKQFWLLFIKINHVGCIQTKVSRLVHAIDTEHLLRTVYIWYSFFNNTSLGRNVSTGFGWVSFGLIYSELESMLWRALLFSDHFCTSSGLALI